MSVIILFLKLMIQIDTPVQTVISMMFWGSITMKLYVVSLMVSIFNTPAR